MINIALLALSVLVVPAASPTDAAPPPVRATETSTVEIIDFCELIAHAGEYDGKTLTVRAVYAAGMEGGIFFGDKCQRSETGDSQTAQAVFADDVDWRRLRLYKKLRALVSKNNLGEAEVTMTGEFTDGKARVFGHQMCCRYRLRVTQLLSVEKVELNSFNRNGWNPAQYPNGVRRHLPLSEAATSQPRCLQKEANQSDMRSPQRTMTSGPRLTTTFS